MKSDFYDPVQPLTDLLFPLPAAQARPGPFASLIYIFIAE